MIKWDNCMTKENINTGSGLGIGRIVMSNGSDQGGKCSGHPYTEHKACRID